MNHVRLEPFHADDMFLIRPHEGDEFPGFRYATVAERGPGLTAWVGNVPVGAAGIIRLWGRVGEAWAYLSPWCDAHPLFLHRAVLRELPIMIAGLNLKRVQAYVRADDKRYWKWPELLGMKVETLLQSYGPHGEDYFLYRMLLP